MDTLVWVGVDFLWWLKIKLLALNLLSNLRTLGDIHAYARKPSRNVELAHNVSHGGGRTCWRCLGGLQSVFEKYTFIKSLWWSLCALWDRYRSNLWGVILKEWFWDTSRIEGGRVRLSIEFEWLRDVGISAFGMALVRFQVRELCRSVGSQRFRESSSSLSGFLYLERQRTWFQYQTRCSTKSKVGDGRNNRVNAEKAS
jgi:hypothetical protein